MFGQYNDLILILLGLGQVAIICLLLLRRSDSKKRKILLVRNRNLEKENDTLRFTIPRLVMLSRQNADDIEQRGKQIDQINTYLGEVLGVSNLIGFDNEKLNAAEFIEELREKIKWAEETRNITSKNDRDYYNSK